MWKGAFFLSEKQQTKLKIIDTALEEIEQQGFENLSLRKLASNCGLTTGAFYRHFANKNDLFMVLMLKLSATLTSGVGQKNIHSISPRKELLFLGENIFTLFSEKKNLVDFLFFNPVAQSIYAKNEKIQDTFPLLKTIHQLIIEIIDRETLDLDPTTTFIQVWSFLQGYMLLVRNGVTQFDTELLADTLNSLLLKKGM